MVFNETLINTFERTVDNIRFGHYYSDRDDQPAFRYPGEMLERFEEKGYTTDEDKISMLYAFSSAEEHFTEKMFVGTQKEDFLDKMRKFKNETHSTYAAAYLYLSGDSCEEDLTSFASALSERDFVYVISDLTHYHQCSDPNRWYDMMSLLLSVKPELPQNIHSVFPVTNENINSYLWLLTLSVTMQKYPFTEELKEWKNIFAAFKPLFSTVVTEGSTAAKKLYKYGYSYESILDINCGTFEYYRLSKNNYYTGFSAYDYSGEFHESLISASYVKSMRLKRLWIKTRILSSETVPDWMQNMLLQTHANEKDKKLQRKIDGFSDYDDFLYRSIEQQPQNPENSALLFRLGIFEHNQVSFDFAVNHPVGVSFDRKCLEILKDAFSHDREKKLHILFTDCIMSEWIKYSGNDDFVNAVSETENFFDMSVTHDIDIYALPVDDAVFYLIDVGYLSFKDIDEIVRERYLSSHDSHQSYLALVEFYNNLDLSDLREMDNFLSIMPSPRERCLSSAISADEKKNLIEIELELKFQASNDYLETLCEDISDENVRMLYPDEELRQIYDLFVNSTVPYAGNLVERYNLHTLFLTDQELQEKAEQEQKRKEEEERAKKQREFEEARESFTRAFDSLQTDGEKVEKVIKKLDFSNLYNDSYCRAWLSVLSELTENAESEPICISTTSACKLLSVFEHQISQRTATFEQMKKILNKIAVEDGNKKGEN